MKLQFKAEVKGGGSFFRVPELQHKHLVGPLMNTSQFNRALWQINRKRPGVVPKPGMVLVDELPENVRVVGEQGFF